MLSSSMAHSSMISLTGQVLPFRTPKYMLEFRQKLAQQGICTPADFLGASKDAFDKKAQAFPGWDFIEVADAVSLHQAVAGKGRGRGGGTASGHGGPSGKWVWQAWRTVGQGDFQPSGGGGKGGGSQKSKRWQRWSQSKKTRIETKAEPKKTT